MQNNNIVFNMLALKSQTDRGADGSVQQTVDLSASYEDGKMHAMARVMFSSEDTLGTIRPGHMFRVTFEDLGPTQTRRVEEGEAATSDASAATSDKQAAEASPTS